MSQHGCPERLSNRSKGFQDDGPSQPTMEVLVETLTGTAFEMTVSPSDTIFAIKSKIFRVEGIPISQQHLLYNLKELEDSTSLGDHSIADGARLRLVLGMRGGPISTRRLPPPAPPVAEPYSDIERLLDSNREDGDWAGACKVTVLVFRDGERVNMLRVRENNDGTYSPLDHNKYSSSVTHAAEQATEPAPTLQENAVTQTKMMEIRRRMEMLSLQRQTDRRRPEKVEIQKTRSEETLSGPSLLDDSSTFRQFNCQSDDTIDSYTRYEYDCAFTDRFTLPPLISPIGARNADAAEDELKLSDTLAGSILVREDAAILEECIDSEDSQFPANSLAPIPTTEYGPLVGGGVAWRGMALGGPPPSHSHAHAHTHAHSHSHSASSLQLRAPPPAPRPPLSDALFSSSTSELEKLKRTSRILPALSRHRNREHLHLSDEGLHLRTPPPPQPQPQPQPPTHTRPHRFEEYGDTKERAREAASKPEQPAADTGAAVPAANGVKEKKVRLRCAQCRKRLSVASVHACACGARLCAAHRYAEAHACSVDYAPEHARRLRRANPPRLAAPKLPKI